MPNNKNLSKYVILVLFIFVFHVFLNFPFEVPDEQSHFATVQFLVGRGEMPQGGKIPDLSLEEQKTQYIFGIMTDGTNKYSHNPMYRPEYTDTIIGKYENTINELNTQENRTIYSIRQAAIYPPLYYWLTSLIYRIVDKEGIIIRLFAVRFGSIIISSAVILFAYLLGLKVYKNKSYSLTLATMVLFYPMTTFLGASINSDALHNLLFIIFVYLNLKLMQSGWSRKLTLFIGVIIGLDLITKPQAYIMFPILISAIIIRWEWGDWKRMFKHLFLMLVPITLIAGWQEIPKFLNSGLNNYSEVGGKEIVSRDFIAYSMGFLNRLSKEIVVWYWGVFKWQGVLMPRIWWWSAIRLMGLAGVGIILRLFRDWKKKKLSWLGRVTIFSIMANLIYIAALFWFDWQFYQRTGRSLGMQARYYMPLLVSQMALMLIGLTELGWNRRTKEWIRKGLILFFLGLQLTAVYTVASSYYDITSLQSFIIQASQYKPWYAKGSWWYLWITSYILSISLLSITAIKGNETHSKKKNSN